MANSLFFTLDAKRKMGLEFTSHRGSQINLDPGKSTKLPLSDDEPMSKDELIQYYDFRYKRFGLDTKYLAENAPAVNGTKIAEIKEEEKKTFENPTVEEVTEPAKVEDAGKSEETATVEKVEEEKASDLPAAEEATADERPVEEWDFKEMTAFVKENNLKTKGNSKKDYIAAIKEFKEEA